MIIDAHAHIAPRDLITEMGPGYTLESAENDSFLIRTPIYTVRIPEAMFSVREQRKAMDTCGIDKRVLSIAPFLMAPEKTGSDAIAWVKAANDDLAHQVTEDTERFVGFGFLHLEDTAAAVEEIVRCTEQLGLCGFQLPTNFRGEDLIAPEFTPVFQELNKRALPVLIHPTMVRMGPSLRPYALGNLLGNPFETAVAAAKMLVTDFFQSYPEIRFLFSHGGGALPALTGRIAHKHHGIRGEEGRVELPANVYFDEVVFEEDMLRFLNQRFGNLVFGTDAPFDMAEEEPVRFAQQALGAEGIASMVRNTSAFVYGKSAESCE